MGIIIPIFFIFIMVVLVIQSKLSWKKKIILVVCISILCIIALSYLFITGFERGRMPQPAEKNAVAKQDLIISKTYHKKGTSDTDTLWVSQNDTTVFKKEEFPMQRPCSDAKWTIRYDLIKPKKDAYYYIYNENQQLVLEGKYETDFIFEGKATGEGDFYNSKNYEYEDNGDLVAISYMQDGRHTKTETFDSNGKIEKIFYKNKKSGDTEKIAIYKNGKLRKTRIYTAFDTYYTVDADE